MPLVQHRHQQQQQQRQQILFECIKEPQLRSCYSYQRAPFRPAQSRLASLRLPSCCCCVTASLHQCGTGYYRRHSQRDGAGRPLRRCLGYSRIPWHAHVPQGGGRSLLALRVLLSMALTAAAAAAVAPQYSDASGIYDASNQIEWRVAVSFAFYLH